jgi:DMSO/TMAO reductase YedYZ molybdopterin-dependent catalytic subunit
MGRLILSGAIERPTAISPEQMEALVTDHEPPVDEVPVAPVAALAVPRPDAAFCSVVSSDGGYTASIPVDDLLNGGVLLLRSDGRRLTGDEGGPIRLVVRQGKTLCWNVKDVGELRFTVDKEPDSVPARPSH